MLPAIGTTITRLPLFEHVRDIEVFGGPLLAELRDENSASYIEKWCSRDETSHRTLIVRTDQRSVAEYIGGRLPMRELLIGRSSGIGFLCDYTRDGFHRATVVEVSALPARYLPSRGARHDPSLRPPWPRVPQEFLVDHSWDAEVLHDAEKAYHEVSSFIYAANNRPEVIRQYLSSKRHDSGWTYGQSFGQLRGYVPNEAKPRTKAVQASSPGVLSMEAPREVAIEVTRAILRAQEQTAKSAYAVLHSWSRYKTDNAENVPNTAERDIKGLCSALGISADAMLSMAPASASRDENEPAQPLTNERKKALLQIGKLVAGYYRRLFRVMEPADGVSFILDRSLAGDYDDEYEDDEDDEDDEGWDEDRDDE